MLDKFCVGQNNRAQPNYPSLIMLTIFRIVLGFFFVVLLSFNTEAAGGESDVPPKGATLVYVGTFTDTPAKSRGIYLFWLRDDDSKLSSIPTLVPLGLAAETQNPSFLTVDSKRRRLFCANEINSFQGTPSGAVSAFAIDPATGKLKFINQRASMGAGPCHLTLDKTGKNLLVANYASGSVAVLPIGVDGELGEATSVMQDAGKGPNPARQEGPHAHCTMLSPDNRFAFCCDLGIDKVMIYKFDAENGKLIPNKPAFVQLTPGSGPRHLVFHPNGKFAFLISELASTITTFAYDRNKGALHELQTVSSLPAWYHDYNKAAEIAVTPSGKFLFASNRGDDAIVLFAIDPKKGTLTWVEEQKTGGKTPRQFGIEPSGRCLVVGNQDSDTVLVCGIDEINGRLKPSPSLTPVPSPACAVFFPPVGASSGRKQLDH
jgi:6-phosphogluconolactonase